jgi:hypothetical protein
MGIPLDIPSLKIFCLSQAVIDHINQHSEMQREDWEQKQKTKDFVLDANLPKELNDYALEFFLSYPFAHKPKKASKADYFFNSFNPSYDPRLKQRDYSYFPSKPVQKESVEVGRYLFFRNVINARKNRIVLYWLSEIAACIHLGDLENIKKYIQYLPQNVEEKEASFLLQLTVDEAQLPIVDFFSQEHTRTYLYSTVTQKTRIDCIQIAVRKRNISIIRYAKKNHQELFFQAFDDLYAQEEIQRMVRL